MDSNESNKFEEILTLALKTPGIKVDREEFLRKELIQYVSGGKVDEAIKTSTIEADIDITILNKMAKNLINKRTTQTSSASFFAGLPGGIAMAATIPADTLQFFGVALRLAQELAYIYGYKDLWMDGEIDDERVKNELTIFLGAMFGIGGASTTLRLISTNISKQVLKKLPQKALTKTIYYPIIKKIAAAIGIKMTKQTFAKSISKTVPIIGGVISGGITYASMKPMGNKLKDALINSVNKDYTIEDMEKDISDLEKETGETIGVNFQDDSVIDVEFTTNTNESTKSDSFDLANEIMKFKNMLDNGIITEEEFKQIKQDLIQKNM